MKPKSFSTIFLQTTGFILIPILLILIPFISFDDLLMIFLIFLLPVTALIGVIGGYSSMKVEEDAEYSDYETFRCSLERILNLRNYHIKEESDNQLVFSVGRMNYDITVNFEDGKAKFIGPRNNVSMRCVKLKGVAFWSTNLRSVVE